VVLEDPNMPLELLQNVAAKTEAALRLDEDHSVYSFEVSAKDPYHNATGEPAITVVLNEDEKTGDLVANLLSMTSTLEVTHAPPGSAGGDAISAFLAQEVRRIFQDEQASIAYLLRGSSFSKASKNFQLSHETTQAIERRTTRAFKYASTYHVTFSLFAASASPSAWDIEEAIQQYINPLLRQLATVSDFHVDTQVQLFASFSPSIAAPQLDETSNTYKLLHSDLSGFINAAEWPLSPSIGSGPTLNMVLYVPAPEQSPLLLETGGNSWTIPQWGGVQILNPANKQTQRLTSSDLEPVMLTFADQLMALLGVPSTPQSLALRIQRLKRERATSLILSASSTLGALVRLTRKLESIAIPASVATSVDETLSHLDQACGNLREGRYQLALENARVAEAEAEKAFFEPSMVGQVYFPDEHKVAVYVPLLGPMAVPLVMSALKELKNWRQGRKVKTL
jgi:phosphatidylinositol glycan class S